MIISLRSIRSVSSSQFQGLSLRGVSYVPLRVSFPSLLLWLRYIFSSCKHSPTPININRHVYKLVSLLHLLKPIGEENDGHSAILKGVERFGNTR